MAITSEQIQLYCAAYGLEFWDHDRLIKHDPFEWSDTVCAGIYPQSITNGAIMGIALTDDGDCMSITSWDDNGGDETDYVSEEEIAFSISNGMPLHAAWEE